MTRTGKVINKYSAGGEENSYFNKSKSVSFGPKKEEGLRRFL